jgi:sugar phosphate isomerase/epimerase
LLSVKNKLALHTWTLDSTPLGELLNVARSTGWDAVELRRLDFERAEADGQSEEQVLDLVRACALPVSAVGVTSGWMLARGSAREHLLEIFTRSCVAAASLDCAIVMSPVDKERGDPRQAATSVREVGDIAARYGVRIALEFNSQAAQFNSLACVREVLAMADHPACGLLLDTYHLQRSGCGGRGFAQVAPEEIAYVQYSDVPSAGLQQGNTLDRLPPGRGCVAFDEVFGLLAEKGYAGPLSYEAPNPTAWKRDPAEVAREALLGHSGAVSDRLIDVATARDPRTA